MAGALAALAMGAASHPGAAATLAQTPDSTPATTVPGQNPRLRIDAGYSGAYQPTAAIPVRVTVTAERLIRGTLQVDVPGGVPIRVPLQVAGGSRKRIVVAAPAPDASGTITVRASIAEANLSSEVQIGSRDTAELVGLLPGMLGGRPLPAPASLSVDVGSARFAEVTDAEMALAPASIEALGTLVAAPDDLQALSERERRAVALWVAGGGHLLIPVEAGARVTALPAALQPGRSGRALVGAGEVVAAGRTLGTGSWDGAIDPTPLGGRRASVGFGRGGPRFGLADELAADTGFRVPRLRWLVPGLAGYVAVLGALAALLLRRRRIAPWTWVALAVIGPAVGVGVAVAARSSRSFIAPAHASILLTGPQGTEGLTFVGVARGDPGVATVVFPTGWSAEGIPIDVTSFGSGSTAATTGRGVMQGTRLRTEVELGAGAFGVVAARGPVTSRGELEVSAAAETDDRVSGTVRNTTPWPLEQVAVFVDTGSTVVGSLAPGEERPWTIFVADFSGSDRAPGLEVWPVASRFGGGSDTTGVNFPAWWAWASARLPRLLGPGRALGVGWTSQPVPAVQLDRPVPTKGRTAIVGTALVSGDPDRPPRAAVVRTVLRSGDGGSARFDLPEGATSPSLVAHVVTGTQLDAWVDGAWKSLTGANGSPTAGSDAAGSGAAGSDAAGSDAAVTTTTVSPFSSSVLSWTDVPLPGGAVRDGQLYLRANGFLIAAPGNSPIDLVTVGAPRAEPAGAGT